MPDKAVLSAGGSSITVYGDTAKLVNTLVSVTMIVCFIGFISKVVK